jgi:PAS domain S-box-containing protein
VTDEEGPDGLRVVQRDLQAARLRGAQFQQRALEAVEGAALLPEALEELSTVLEELRVTDEQLRAQQEQLAEARQTVETERDQYLELLEAAPAAYLITDRVGVIQQANRRAAGLLGVAQQFLVGRPLAMFVVAEDRWALRDRLSRGGNLEWGSWQLRLQPRRHEPVPTVVATSVIHDQGRRGGRAALVAGGAALGHASRERDVSQHDRGVAGAAGRTGDQPTSWQADTVRGAQLGARLG